MSSSDPYAKPPESHQLDESPGQGWPADPGALAPEIRPLIWRRWTWPQLIVSLSLAAAALWLISREVDPSAVARALGEADWRFVLLALGVILLTIGAKTWRWRLLFATPGQAPPLRDLFWAIMTGQLLNSLLWRIGDLARIYDLGRQTGRSKAQILSTVAVEKSLDMIFLALTVAALVPFLLLPESISRSGLFLAAVGSSILGVLALLAFRAEGLLALARRVAAILPAAWRDRSLRLTAAGLAGLASLRRRDRALTLLIFSTLIAFLAVVTPWVLFPAFGLPLGLKEAVLLHLVTTLGTVPPSTPARLGVFEWLVLFTLRPWVAAGDSLGLSYALAYHGVVLLPQIVLGCLAVLRWRHAILPDRAPGAAGYLAARVERPISDGDTAR